MVFNGNAILVDAKLKKDKHGDYYLILVYKGTDTYGNTHKLVIDGLPLSLYKTTDFITAEVTRSMFEATERNIDIGFGSIPFGRYTKVTDEIIDYATKEMTLEEIEKKLGYKVKIISDKEGK